MRRLELLAPAKDYETAVAAIDCGADAVYMGGPRFGARRDAGNSLQQIERTADYARRFGVRLYCTTNTLLFDDELAEAERQARSLLDAGVDALIVQDAAYLRMGLKAELHASTQCCNRTPEQAAFLSHCGFARVVLERALSLDEIRAVRRACDVELECFIHGAICVSHSGRCFLSRSMQGGRSGNRGACSQPCRLTWDLLGADGRRIEQGRHLLSLRDLDLTERLGALVDAGVDSFKIEGRLKERNYVRNAVAWYRNELDRIIARRDDCERASVGRSHLDFTPDPRKSFTRGGTRYYIDGRRRGAASFDTPKSIGEFIARVERVEGDTLLLDRSATLAPGDGLCFPGAGSLAGSSVNAVDGRRVRLNRRADMAPGTEVYRNYDRLFNQQLERSRTRRAVAVEAAVEADADSLRLHFVDEQGCAVSVCAEGPFLRAKDPEGMARVVGEQLVRSGDTIFDVTVARPLVCDRFVPVSTIARLRRRGLAELADRRAEQRLRLRQAVEDRSARAPFARLDASGNVTNRLSEAFWRDHGVERIEPGFDAGTPTAGRRVMECSYCIRREIGACLRTKTTLRDDLFLVHGARRYRLDFDCAACLMYLVEC